MSRFEREAREERGLFILSYLATPHVSLAHLNTAEAEA
jgi:hypothetical protein